MDLFKRKEHTCIQIHVYIKCWTNKACPQADIWHSFWQRIKLCIYTYIYIGKHIYRHIYITPRDCRVTSSLRQRNILKSNDMNHWHHCVSFVWHDWTFVAHLIFFFAKQIGEFDWTWFHIFVFLHWCSSWWTPHHCIWSKRWTFPHKIGLEKRVGNGVGRVKQNFYTHNFVSYPPTHHMLEGKCHKK